MPVVVRRRLGEAAEGAAEAAPGRGGGDELIEWIERPPWRVESAVDDRAVVHRDGAGDVHELVERQPESDDLVRRAVGSGEQQREGRIAGGGEQCRPTGDVEADGIGH
ncbi:MAG: hypothetical protein FD127_2596 [Acidimicrobiaceae bacterium]|nr:MAG: hypothetical protein FD127_2596 [Acidimicrobiaceae bacterium]